MIFDLLILNYSLKKYLKIQIAPKLVKLIFLYPIPQKMEQIQNIFQKTCKKDINQSQIQNPSNCKENLQIYSSQCILCLNQYSQQNNPVKICINDHNMCQKCVQAQLFKENSISYHGQTIIVHSCPFCGSLLDFSMFVTNYKTLNMIKHQKQQSKSLQSQKKCKTSIFQSLPESSYGLIMQFLAQKDKINLSSTNILLRAILMDEVIWGQFVISDCLNLDTSHQDYQKNWNHRLKWIQKYFTVIKPSEIKITVLNFCNEQRLLQLFLKDYGWVNKLTLFCQSIELHLALAKSCAMITALNVSSAVFSDQILEEMTKSMQSIKSFTVVKDDSNFTGKHLSRYFPNGLQSIVMKPHLLNFTQIALLVQKNPQNIRQVQLDVQECSEQVLIQIISSLQNVQVLKLFHLQNIHIPQQLAKSLSNKVRQLYLTKAYDMPIKSIVQKIATPKLLTIDLTQVNMFDDSDVNLLSKRCPYLRKINFSWCNKVSESSIAQLIQSCPSLQFVNLTGLKNLADSTFIEYAKILPYFDQGKYDMMRHEISKARLGKKSVQKIHFTTEQFFNFTDFRPESQQHSNQKRGKSYVKLSVKQILSQIKTLKNLSQLICISCNNISDKILKMIYLINRKVNVVNYYSNSLGLYAIDELQDEN